jgi:hypothetical protein
MFAKIARFAPLSLVACVAAQPAVPVDHITVGTGNYPVFAEPDGGWRVMIDGHPVPCLHPDHDTCTWSARNFLQAGASLDDLG